MDPSSPKTRLQAPWGEGPLSFLLSSWTWTQYRDTINPDKNEGRTRTTELVSEKLPCLIYLGFMWTQWHLHVIFFLNKTNFSKILKKKKNQGCILAHSSFWFILQSRMSHCSKWPRNFRNPFFFFFFKEKNSTEAKNALIPYQQSLRNDFSTKGHLQQRLPLLMGSDHRSMNNPLTSIGLLCKQEWPPSWEHSSKLPTDATYCTITKV